MNILIDSKVLSTGVRYFAYFEDDPENYCEGNTPAEAVGQLFFENPAKFKYLKYKVVDNKFKFEKKTNKKKG